MSLSRKVITLTILSIASISCAATSDITYKRKEAVLLNPDRSDIREAIRVFVRQDAGRFVIADPNSLLHSPNMVVHRRASDFERRSRSLPPANKNYRLLSNGADCWLIRHESTVDSPIATELLLPASARCEFYAHKE